jgi:hypothetical protein
MRFSGVLSADQYQPTRNPFQSKQTQAGPVNLRQIQQKRMRKRLLLSLTEK